MFLIKKTTEFDKWLRKLKDIRAKAKILIRIQKLENDAQRPVACRSWGFG